MSNLKVNPGLLKSKVAVPASKSYANRALILSAISNQPIILKHIPSATDVTNLILCLESLGLVIVKQNDSIQIMNSFPACESEGVTIHVGEGGTTARFLSALVLLGSKTYHLILGERLKMRPWQEFLEFVQLYGGMANLDGNRLTIKGPLKLPPELSIDCSKTTQFASAFQMAFSNRGVKVKPIHLNSSSSYWRMSEDLIQKFKNLREYEVPSDWSSASYPLAFGALNQEILFPHLSYDPYQADAKFLKLLEQLGAIEKETNGIRVKPFTRPQIVKMDVSDALDLVPTLSFLLGHIPGRHELFGVENLVHKESDRLAEVIKLLKHFERVASSDGKTLCIEGTHTKIKRAVNLVLPDDHRMVMVATLFLRHHSGGVVEPIESVKKSYPQFFDLLL